MDLGWPPPPVMDYLCNAPQALCRNPPMSDHPEHKIRLPSRLNNSNKLRHKRQRRPPNHPPPQASIITVITCDADSVRTEPA
jgi:hypothetical protein